MRYSRLLEKEISRYDCLIDLYLYDDPKEADKYLWMREAVKRLKREYDKGRKTIQLDEEG